MDFRFVLERLLDGFERLKIRYAVMGGFALGALGAPRATQDLDFLVHKDDLARLHELLTGLGYRRIYHSENVSQYEGESVLWGFLDFIHAFREVAVGMLARALDKPVLSGARSIKVLTPEDVIGLKVQAMANDPSRAARETADIQALARANAQLDWERVAQFYALFGMGEALEGLKRQLDAERKG